jgi:lipoate-protein ligase A
LGATILQRCGTAVRIHSSAVVQHGVLLLQKRGLCQVLQRVLCEHHSAAL